MARRKRSTRFAGTDAEHEGMASEAHDRAAGGFRDAIEAADNGKCKEAFEAMRSADRNAGMGYAHSKETHPRMSASSAKMNAQQKTLLRLGREAGVAVKSCMTK